MKRACLVLALLLILLTACGPGDGTPEQTGGGTPSQTQGTELPVTESSPDMPYDGTWSIRVIDTTGEEAWSFTETSIANALESFPALPSGTPGKFTHVYSAVNNWPTARYYAAEGFSVVSILAAAGLYDSAQTVTFRSDDGYEISLTRDQIHAPQYFYPQVNENDDGAEPVYPIIAYRWREGSDDLSAIREDNPCLIIGQRNPFEHTNPAFVENISEIIVSTEPCEKWPPASTFPAPGFIPAGETVKLQHLSYGLVKLHYTLDGSEPTILSTMYNPSTYRPELNVPIPITETTEIRVIVYGYGKTDSEVAVFQFTPQD